MKIPNITAFAIEGPDKVGKATQSMLLYEALDGFAPCPVHRIEIPSGNHTCYDKIYDMLDRRPDGSAPAVDHPEVFQTFQVANRFHVQEGIMKTRRPYRGEHSAFGRLVRRGQRGQQRERAIIIFDRWVASSWAYGRASGVSDEKIRIINEGLLVPDVTFVLQGRGFDRPEQGDDAYEDDDSFQANVRKMYAEWAAVNAHAHAVDADQDRESVHEEILSVVNKCLIEKGIL